MPVLQLFLALCSAHTIVRASDKKQPEDPAQYEERKGAYHFVAYEILKFTGVTHDAHHDLESFYWVLLWVVVCLTKHGHERGDQLCSDIFKFGEDRTSASAKRDWLEDEKLDILNNKPLTYLMSELGAIVLEHIPTLRRGVHRVLLGYERVLKIFDEAIEMPGWPTRAWQPCNLLKSDGRSGIANVAGPKRPKPPGLITALDEAVNLPADDGRLPPLPTHSDLPAPHSLDPRLLSDVFPKKRSCDTLDEEESELDCHGTGWMTPSRTNTPSKRVRTNEGPRPATRSQSGAAHESLVAPR
ncbi:uncharacterized protein TRAVEDRAFT_21436 [Trametes versicolor FP-101664 SS1]|uniref:uncharacterized protein n=1 Tax=Trametes versicolor (strain FP-101664) TaxID=717944 RepID=UPI000462287F|nr:uncharacterized protein TRAVEDRAFT_21436 [Trametes versicolor FP-101664 SS1]EIW58003.1 hypothetical protein TRAVEDRAFT_21436 [Trametes versicolor FP-101664 SS1]